MIRFNAYIILACSVTSTLILSSYSRASIFSSNTSPQYSLYFLNDSLWMHIFTSNHIHLLIELIQLSSAILKNAGDIRLSEGACHWFLRCLHGVFYRCCHRWIVRFRGLDSSHFIHCRGAHLRFRDLCIQFFDDPSYLRSRSLSHAMNLSIFLRYHEGRTIGLAVIILMFYPTCNLPGIIISTIFLMEVRRLHRHSHRRWWNSTWFCYHFRCLRPEV